MTISLRESISRYWYGQVSWEMTIFLGGSCTRNRFNHRSAISIGEYSCIQREHIFCYPTIKYVLLVLILSFGNLGKKFKLKLDLDWCESEGGMTKMYVYF